MKSRVVICAGLLLLGAVCARAQLSTTDLYGQIFLPGGDPPSSSVRYMLKSDDGVRNEFNFTDSNGRFTINALNNRNSYTIVVTGDDINYGDTVYQVPPLSGRRMRVTIDLNPPAKKPTAPGRTISAASGYKALPQAGNAYEKAQKQIQKNNLDQAEVLLRKAVAADAKFAAAANDLGVLLMKEKKYPEAEPYLRQSLEADPKFIHALLNLGITLNHLEKYDEAIPPLREAIRLEPGLTVAHLQLGCALVSIGEYTEGERELLAVKKVRPDDDVLAELFLGQLYARTGKFEKSIEAFHSYLEKAPNAANAPVVRAVIAKMQNQLAVRQ